MTVAILAQGIFAFGIPSLPLAFSHTFCSRISSWSGTKPHAAQVFQLTELEARRPSLTRRRHRKGMQVWLQWISRFLEAQQSLEGSLVPQERPFLLIMWFPITPDLSPQTTLESWWPSAKGSLTCYTIRGWTPSWKILVIWITPQIVSEKI